MLFPWQLGEKICYYSQLTKKESLGLKFAQGYIASRVRTNIENQVCLTPKIVFLIKDEAKCQQIRGPGVEGILNWRFRFNSLSHKYSKLGTPTNSFQFINTDQSLTLTLNSLFFS